METPSELSEFRGPHIRPGEPGLAPGFPLVLLASVLMAVSIVAYTPATMHAPVAQFIETAYAPVGAMIGWVPKDDTEKQVYAIGGYTITLSTHIHKNGERAAQLSVRAPSGEPTSIYGQVGFPIPSAKFGVGKFDRLSDSKQIVLTTYSGGLHCCTKVTVLDLVDGKWRKVQLGLWDGEPLPEFPKDVDDDGTADFVLTDDRFDYAFAPYSDSHKPPRIFNVERGRVVEVGHEPRFDAVYEADMKHAHGGCLKHKNAACAAFVADAVRLDRRDWAWKIMLANYRPSTDWDFPIKCKVAKVDGLCPPGQTEQFREFPEALAWFLTDTGYTKP
jgi:hypothetical protein